MHIKRKEVSCEQRVRMGGRVLSIVMIRIFLRMMLIVDHDHRLLGPTTPFAVRVLSSAAMIIAVFDTL